MTTEEHQALLERVLADIEAKRPAKQEQLRKKWRERYARNPDTARAASDRWGKKNPDKRRVYYNKWLTANPGAASAASKKWKSKNEGHVKAYKDQYYKENGDKLRADARDRARVNQASGTALKQYRKWRYGVSPEQYDAMFDGQDKRCLICKTDDPGPKGWHVDHDHTTGKVRGILCRRCNLMLGFACDNPGTLSSAIGYLEEQSEGDPGSIKPPHTQSGESNGPWV